MGFKFNTLLRAILAGGSSRTYPATFNVLLSNPVGCTISDSTIAVTIQSNPIIPRVSLSRTTGKAPLAVGFDATTTTSPLTTNPNHDLFYAWSFGDAAGETWSYGATPGLDKNLAYGPVAGHVFKTAGTFNCTLTVMDGRGNIATSSGSVVVSEWSEADTYYVATGSAPVPGANGVPAGAVGAQCVSAPTWAEVVALWDEDKRIMHKRGDTWAVTSNSNVPTGMEVNAYGTGAAPLLTSASASQGPFRCLSGQSDVRICNVKHTGPRTNVADTGTLHLSTAETTNILMLGVESDGATFGLVSSIPYTLNMYDTFVVDCNFYNCDSNGISSGWLPENMCMYVSHAYGLYILGSRFDKAATHTVRIMGTQRCVIDSSEISGPSQADPGTGGSHALTIREIGNDTGTWSGQYTQDVVVSNNKVSSGWSQWLVKVGPSGDMWAGKFRRMLFERNFVDSAKAGFVLAVGETVTLRSNIIKTTNWNFAVALYNPSTATPDPSPDPVGIQFYNNTIDSQYTGAFAAFSLGPSRVQVTDTTIRNNLVYAPSASSQTLVATSGTVVNTIADHNSSDAQMLSTRPWTSATPSVPADFTPVNYALDAGVFDYRSQRDFYNVTITAPVDIGAIRA